MLKLWRRFLNIFKAKANATLDDMENPIEMYKLGIDEFETKLKQGENAIAKLMAQASIKTKELEQFRLESIRRHDQAKQALVQQREDLAKTSLELKAAADKKIVEYDLICKALDKQVQDLRKDHERNKKKLKESQTKYDIYKAKYETSLVQREIASSMSDLGGETALSNLNKYERQIEQISEEATALDTMVNTSARMEDELETITIDAEIVDSMDLLRAEAEMEKRQKEKDKQDKINKLLFAEEQKTKQLDAPKIALNLNQETVSPKKGLLDHLNEDPKKKDSDHLF